MGTRGKTILLTTAGLGAGVFLVLLALKEAGAGHGTYTAFAVASLPGMALGMGDQLGGTIFMLGLPPVQWAFLGFCVARCLFAKAPAWSLGFVAVGLAYFLAGWLGHSNLRTFFSHADSVILPGLFTGAVLICAGTALWAFTARKLGSVAGGNKGNEG